MSKNILYMTYDGLTDPLGQSQVLPYMLKIVKEGFHVTIISFEKGNAFLEFRSEIENQISESGIEWMPLMYTKRPPVFSTVWDILKLKRLASKLCDDRTINVVHCRSYITSLVGLSLKLRKGIPFLFDMRGFWADERVEGGLWNKKNPIYYWVYSYFKKKEISFLKHADHIITLTHKSKSIIDSWQIKGQLLPITVIPTCVDLDHFDINRVGETQTIKLKEQLGIDRNAFVLSYIGSLGTWYMLREMIQFFSFVVRKDSKAILLLITRDSPEPIYAYCKEFNVNTENIRIKSTSRFEMPLLISVPDWSLFFIKPVFSKSASSPTKLAEIISMNKPVLCNGGVGDLDVLFQTHKLGICLSDFSEQSFEKASEFMLSNRHLKVDRMAIAEHFSLSAGVAKLKNIYQSLIV